MSKIMNIGIIGTGTITGNHITGLGLIPEKARIAAVCDVNLDAAKAAAAPLGVPVYSDYKEMIKNEKLDIALICLPHFLHCPVGLDVLNSGLHLFIEKPMAISTAECKTLIEAAKKNGKDIFVGQTHQYRSVFAKAKEMVKTGVIGELKMIVTEVIAYYNWENRKAWFLDPKKAGGGALFNTSPHQADHLLYLVDSPITKVKASVAALRPGQVVDSDTVAFMDYANGVQGIFMVFQGTKMEDPARLKIKLLGTEGTIQFNPFGNEIELAKLDKVEKIQTDPDLNPFRAEWTEFIEAIASGRRSRTDAAYGYNVVALLEAMVKSSNTRSEVSPELL
ncbi:MAG: hypothetical protein A2020_00220 [Lentisphaerae bacterium GWF2_45_14]|nr:MAG: hypothetical protein A2020_00220 [Lentisphaerae bacterium GWF2_45_14]